MWLNKLNPFSDDFLGGMNRSVNAEDLYGGVDPNGDMARVSGGAEQFGQAGQRGYQQLGREAAWQRNQLRDRAAGRDSLSAEQLRQSLATNTAQQMGMAAGARPAGGAAAARTASNNVAMMGAGLAGQQSIAGIQERAAAENQLTQAILGQRAQDAQVGLGGMQTALGGYGGIEQARTNRYGAVMGAPTQGEQILGAGMGAAAMYAKSDARSKKDVKRGDKDAEALIRTVKPVTHRYKNAKDGEGEYTSVMAQDLLKSKAGRGAVVKGADGHLQVHGARLALALAATLPGLDKRLRKIEER